MDLTRLSHKDYRSSDKERLLFLVARSDRRAFDELYHRSYNQVSHTAYYYLEDLEACRDVISDVFFALWNARRSLANVRDIDSYLFKMTRHASLRRLASDKRSRHLRLDELPPMFEVDSGSRTDAGVVADELDRTLSSIVDSLPDRCRLIFMLSRIDGVDNKAIADRLDISESTVRVQIKIAVDKIANGLRQLYPNLSIPMLAFILSGGSQL